MSLGILSTFALILLYIWFGRVLAGVLTALTVFVIATLLSWALSLALSNSALPAPLPEPPAPPPATPAPPLVPPLASPTTGQASDGSESQVSDSCAAPPSSANGDINEEG
ncbi:hypothetical protein B0H14DRAFT_2647563 [Mycena olivaceomarginata]|nr:hypothetical protein B0H14DRAFT_2647563 [Mycena olivaceomarginata]